MRRVIVILIELLLLSGCRQAHPTIAQDVLDAFTAAGLPVPQSAALAADAVPVSGCTERVIFGIPTSEQRGGVVVVCSTPQDGDKAFLALYHAMSRAPNHPRIYQSHDGRIVVQISGKIDSTLAARYEQVVKSLP
jgi:hypothetical protein